MFLLLLVLVIEGCAGVTAEKPEITDNEENMAENSDGVVQDAVVKEILKPEDYVLRDNKALYENDDESSVVTMYLTVRQGNAAEHTNHTWKEVNTYSKYYFEDNGIPQYGVEGILQIGDENGPLPGELGYGLEVPNSIVKIRGQTSSLREQKNYKIELKDGKGTWRTQRTINLNKHVGEGLRFRNKMMYDLMKEVPQMIAARTQFVHLYVKDETEGTNSVFQDYGFYTQVEQMNKKFLANHGLDKNGQLYKINSFEFYENDDIFKMSTDPSYNKESFEKYVEIKGDEDHTKFLEMLKAVNDYSIPIEKTVEKWFDVENICYWMGFHILTGNVDTQNRNYFLYSPTNLNKFYFISWDNDGSFMRTEYSLRSWSDQKGWERGISNYWGSVLFQRMFKNDSYRQQLTNAVEDLRKNYVTKEKVNNIVLEYKDIVKPYVYSMPDIVYAPLTESEYDLVSSAIGNEIDLNYQYYCESLESPMPFYIGVPAKTGDKIQFVWDMSYDFYSETITYTFQLAKDYNFQDLIYSKEDVLVPQIELEMLPAGQYFIRVKAKNETGKMQESFDYYNSDRGKIYSTKCFYILDDGSIVEDIVNEADE